MNGKILCCLGLLGWKGLMASASGDPAAQVKVILQNGNVFSGELLPSNTQLRLQPYWLESPLQIPFGDLKHFQQLTPPVKKDGGEYRVTFPSGNQLRLQSMQSDNDGFLVEASWGGEFMIPKAAVAHIDFLNAAGLLYYGPMVQLRGEEKPLRRALRLPQAGVQWQTEPIPFPKKFQLEIEIRPEAENYIYQVSLFDWKTRAWGSVVFEFTADQISSAWYLRTNPNRMRVKNWRENFPSDPARQRLQFFVDVEAGTFTLLLNGKVIHTWKDSLTESLRVEDPFPIGFRYLSGSAALQISSLQILPWDGVLPGEYAADQQDNLFLKDGERLSGIFLSMDDTQIRFQPKGKETAMSFPLQEIFQMQFAAPTGADSMGLSPQSARIQISGLGDTFMMNVISLEEGQMTGRVSTGAEPVTLSVPFSSVQRLEFPTRTQP